MPLFLKTIWYVTSEPGTAWFNGVITIETSAWISIGVTQKFWLTILLSVVVNETVAFSGVMVNQLGF